MPPNKTKATSKKAPAPATPDTKTPKTPKTATKKRKVDWATIDDKELFQGFTVKPVKSAKSKKTPQAKKKLRTGKSQDGEGEGYRDAPLDAQIVQKNPFPESELSETHYLVDPATEWESTSRYRKFTISEAEFEVGQVIFVSKTAEQQDTEDAIQHWIGRVLEVRAGDQSHVYLRVYWLYRPEDLPGGREAHHGGSELIASNHMDIIEALTVVDRAEVVYWNEDPDSDWPLKDQLFWRQTFDIEKPKAKQFSDLRKFCVDKAPCNPDEPLVNCSACSGWLHAHCLEDQAVQDAYEEHMPPTKGKSKSSRRSSGVEAFSAALTTKGPEGSEQVCLTVTDERPNKKKQTWNVDVKCLLCHELIEKAAPAEPSELNTESKTPIEATETLVLPSRDAAPEESNKTDSVPTNENNSEIATSAASAPADPHPLKSENGEPTVSPLPA